MESYDFSSEAKSVMRKVKCMRQCSDVRLLCGSYEQIIDGLSDYVIYCDPPYEGRTKAHDFATFNYDEFWANMRKASVNNDVYISCFDCPDDFSPVYEWGDTVVRHLNSKGTDGTNEKLVVYKGGRIK
jgi:site-specific DNA-adenine methylase